MKELKVEAIIPGDDKRPVLGELTFIDNTVDKTTGTIILKGTFPNTDRRLWPGQFVNVVLTLTTQRNAVVMPATALQAGQQGQYVFVVKPDQTVESRPVAVAWSYGDLAVVAQGVKPGEKVVTDGQLNLVSGVSVELKGEQPQNAPVKSGQTGTGQASKKQQTGK
jgi:multidrug efflux system membrane fusion protein